jgi:hypothetical protein
VEEHFSQLLNVPNVSGVRQIEVHTAEPLVLGPSLIEVEIAIAKLKKYKSPGSDQIPAELIQAGGKLLLPDIHKFINSLLSTSYKILWNIVLSRLSPYKDKITENHQCRFRRNRSTTDQIFCIRQILGKMGVQ